VAVTGRGGILLTGLVGGRELVAPPVGVGGNFLKGKAAAIVCRTKKKNGHFEWVARAERTAFFDQPKLLGFLRAALGLYTSSWPTAEPGLSDEGCPRPQGVGAALDAHYAA